jgi:hypothetical protein
MPPAPPPAGNGRASRYWKQQPGRKQLSIRTTAGMPTPARPPRDDDVRIVTATSVLESIVSPAGMALQFLRLRLLDCFS